MNGVLQILEVVGEHVGADDRTLIDKGRKAGHALLRILNSILDYSKLVHGAADVDVSRVDIVDVCRTVTELHTAAAATRGIELRSHLDLPPTGESSALTDEVKLFEIINNLVSNALKFTHSGYVELRVGLAVPASAELPAAQLQIRVTDSGCGISESDLGKVFLPFYQRTTAASRTLGGTGLGLSIVHELVLALGGNIDVESSLGHGSSFRVSLPVELVSLSAPTVATASENCALDPVSRARTSEFPGLQMLLVDDNELNAALASRLMQALGFEVVTAADGAIALQLLEHQRFDVVLMDCQMPVMDGYDATRGLRRLEQRGSLPRTPVIAVTAYALAGDREKCIAAGMDDFLSKPYSLSDLMPKLVRWLRPAPQSIRSLTASGNATDLPWR
jgi:CheY-like chemotaxis protein/two-component sensor histidine kinase